MQSGARSVVFGLSTVVSGLMNANEMGWMKRNNGYVVPLIKNESAAEGSCFRISAETEMTSKTLEGDWGWNKRCKGLLKRTVELFAVKGCNSVEGCNVVDEGCNPIDEGCNLADKGCDSVDVLAGIVLSSLVATS